MARRPRLHIPQGAYYVVHFGSARQPLFFAPEHYTLFEELLAGAAKRSGTRVLAYCWLPQAIHLAVQIGNAPLGRFMQGFTSRYARALHRQTHESGYLFARRYRARLIDADRWLLPLIRYLHFLPVTAGIAKTPDAYQYSSHRAYRAYLANSSEPWLHIRPARRLLEAGGDAQGAYAELMSRAPPAEEVRRLEAGDEADPRVIGNGVFLATLPRRVRTPRSRLTLDEIIDAVACLLDIERADLFARSRKRGPALARAVIAWHATERGIASLSEVSRRLRRNPTTLSLAIARHRPRHPELFRLDALRYRVPLAQAVT